MDIYLKQASPKAANIHNRWLSCRRQRSLRSSHEQYKVERGNAFQRRQSIENVFIMHLRKFSIRTKKGTALKNCAFI